MSERQNRTLMCSVLFVDIVKYSLKPVTEQIKLKEHLSALLNDVLKDVALNDRVLLDTGDGAAISFLGDPEDALFAALSLRDGAASHVEAPDKPEMKLRMGINLGPVKLIKDLNGQRNIIGDGINVAQRVISYATPGQVLASRSYFEVVSRMSDEFARLFQYEGARLDKHVREHEIYEVFGGGAGLKRAEDEPTSPEHGGHPGAAVVEHLTRVGVVMKGGLHGRTKLGVALTALLVLGAGVALGLHRTRPSAANTVVQDAASSQPPFAAVEPPAALHFAITPWGEIVVDGEKHGASPPLREIKVPPGMHKIEIRNSRFPSHIMAIDVKPGAQMEIKYRFH